MTDQAPEDMNDKLDLKYQLTSVTKCFYCLTSFTADNTSTVDHIIPRSLGGSDRRYNKLNSCKKCNQFKNDLLPHEFYERVLRSEINWAPKIILLQQIQKTIDYVREVAVQVVPYSEKERSCLAKVKNAVTNNGSGKNLRQTITISIDEFLTLKEKALMWDRLQNQ